MYSRTRKKHPFEKFSLRLYIIYRIYHSRKIQDMIIKKQRTFSLFFLVILLAVFLLPVCFAALLILDMRDTCTAAFESETAATAERLKDLSPHKIKQWFYKNNIQGSLYVWERGRLLPIRYGDDNDYLAFAPRPISNTTETRSNPYVKQRIICSIRQMPNGRMFMLCRDTKLVYSDIRHALLLLAGFTPITLSGLLLLFYRFSVFYRKSTAQEVCRIIKDAPESYPDTGDRKTDLKVHELAQEIAALSKHTEKERRVNMEKVASLAAGMAHDFGNLLTVFRGNLELAEMMSDSTPVKVSLQECKNALEATVKLNNQFLSFARGGAPITSPVSPEEYFKRHTAFILRSFKTGLAFKCEKNLPDAIMDSAQIYHVLNNILLNACHMMNGKGMIHIELKSVTLPKDNPLKLTPGLYLRIRIADNGPGIPPENREKIFYPFYTTRQNGNGLGLPMCLVTMQRHNGSIQAITPPSGHGACFELHLPAVPPVAKVKTESARSEVTESAEIKYQGGGKILILDDQENIRQLLTKILEIMNCQCEGAANEQECIEKYRQAAENGTPFDLVFMDLTLPGGAGGVEILQKLKKEYPDIRAIAASGYSDDEVLADYKKFGFADKLMKPFRLKDVNRIMHSLLPDKQ